MTERKYWRCVKTNQAGQARFALKRGRSGLPRAILRRVTLPMLIFYSFLGPHAFLPSDMIECSSRPPTKKRVYGRNARPHDLGVPAETAADFTRRRIEADTHPRMRPRPLWNVMPNALPCGACRAGRVGGLAGCGRSAARGALGRRAQPGIGGSGAPAAAGVPSCRVR